MKRFLFILLCLLLVSLQLVACTGENESSPPEAGDPALGKDLYSQTVLGPRAAPGCVTCHSLKPGVTLVGPSHAGIAGRAGSMIEGLSAEEYLRESIINPDAVFNSALVEQCQSRCCRQSECLVDRKSVV